MWQSNSHLGAETAPTGNMNDVVPCVRQMVDTKKLEKAEAKLKAKHERRNEKDSNKAPGPLWVFVSPAPLCHLPGAGPSHFTLLSARPQCPGGSLGQSGQQ